MDFLYIVFWYYFQWFLVKLGFIDNYSDLLICSIVDIKGININLSFIVCLASWLKNSFYEFAGGRPLWWCSGVDLINNIF